MPYVNGGVVGITTKKALKEAAKADPADVTFYSTSQLGAVFNGRLTEIPLGVTLSVVGPDPYTARNWYASITRDASGKITVK